jgi:hypothetical protein
MANAPAPHSPTLAASLARLQNRVRWLETNMQPSQTGGSKVGTAWYQTVITDTAADSWTPGSASASWTAEITDTIPLSPYGGAGGFYLDTGAPNLWVAEFALQIEVASYTTGDVLQVPWEDNVLLHQIYPGEETFILSRTMWGTSGGSDDYSAGPSFQNSSLSTVLGSTFSVQYLYVWCAALSLTSAATDLPNYSG